nr:RnfABCDGE type electron transport complex subunit D [uncultured Flavonifractor sp.]
MNEEKKLNLTVASSPHVASPIDTQNLMRDVLIALVPALIMGVVFFGPRALVATIISVLACEFFEWGYRKLMHKSCAVKDLSAAVTGVLLAFVCAPTLPYWMLIIGDFFAIVVVKQLFGGLGQNFMNPALGGRAFLMLCYPVAMTTWVVPGIGADKWAGLGSGAVTMAGADIVTGATPLSADFMHGGLLPEASLLDAFVGNVGGCIGEISALALLLGGIYLIVRGVIRARIPVAYIATVAVLTFLFPLGGNGRLEWMAYQLCTGGLMLGAFFMATDYVTSPVTKKGEVIFGIGCGLLTVFIRYFGGYPEGVSYSILIMNCCVWLIDKVGKPNRYGVTKEMKAAAKAAKKAGKEG